MLQLWKTKSAPHDITRTLEKYSLLLFKVSPLSRQELIRLQKVLLPPRSEREIYRSITPYTFWQVLLQLTSVHQAGQTRERCPLQVLLAQRQVPLPHVLFWSPDAHQSQTSRE